MSQQTNWTQRRRRLVRCKKHDLHFDPSMTSGCALCRKEEPLANHKGPQILVLLLALLGVAFAAYQIFKPQAETASVAPKPSISTLERAAKVLDPERYRDSLTAFEAALYSSSASDFDLLGNQIDDAADLLVAALRRQKANRCEGLAGEVEKLTANFDTTPMNLASLESTRRRWRGLRTRHFDFAPWFRSATTARQDSEQANVLALRGTAEELLSLAWEGSSQATAGDRWATWSSGWRQQILDLRQGLPGRPRPNSNTNTLLGFQHLDKSFSQLLALSADPELPSRSDFENSFSTVISTIEAAQSSFDDVLAR